MLETGAMQLLTHQYAHPKELSQFMNAHAALMDATPAKVKASPYDGILKARLCEGVTPMPPEFELMHPRRARCSGLFMQPDGRTAHLTGYRLPTVEDEAWYRLSDPENGLHPDDLQAFRASISSPVRRRPVARLFARLKFWKAKING